MHFSGESDLQGLKVRQRLNYISKKSKNKIKHMFRKYTYTQVTRELKEIDHICFYHIKRILHGGIHFTKCNFELTSHAISVFKINESNKRK